MIIDEYLKVREAAKAIGFSVQHTRLLIRQGQLKGAKIGRDWIIARESLQMFVAQRNTTPMLPTRKRGRPPMIPVRRRQ